VYSQHDGLSTQVSPGHAGGLRKDSSIHRDALVMRSPARLREFDRALAIALAMEDFT
jgi:hypothetical protein